MYPVRRIVFQLPGALLHVTGGESSGKHCLHMLPGKTIADTKG